MESIEMEGECSWLCLRHAVQGSSQTLGECEAVEERKQRESEGTEKRWRKENKEKVKEQKKRWRERSDLVKRCEQLNRWKKESKEKSDGGLQVILTPMSGAVFEKSLR